MRKLLGCLSLIMRCLSLIMFIILATAVVLIVAITRFFSRPLDPTYTGDYPELFSVATHSILGAYGVDGHQPGITVLEEDNYGRVLFEYSEGNLLPSRLIMQKVEDDYAYFYPHYTFILQQTQRYPSFSEYIPDFQDEEMLEQWLELQVELRELEREDHERRLDEEFPMPGEELSEVRELMRLIWEEVPRFPDEEMERLRQANNWNQPLSNTSELVKVRVVREKETGPVPPEILVDVNNDLFPNSPPFTDTSSISYRMIYLRTDNYGRSIYAAGGDRYVILFQPDHSFDLEADMLVLTERNNYQTELRLFMEANGWDTPSEIDRVISFPFQAMARPNILSIAGGVVIIVYIIHKKYGISLSIDFKK